MIFKYGPYWTDSVFVISNASFDEITLFYTIVTEFSTCAAHNLKRCGFENGDDCRHCLHAIITLSLKSPGWDRVAAFVPLTMCRKMEIAREWQGRPIAAATQHPMPDLAILPPPFLPSAIQQRKQKTIQASLLRILPAANPPPRPEILNKGRV